MLPPGQQRGDLCAPGGQEPGDGARAPGPLWALPRARPWQGSSVTLAEYVPVSVRNASGLWFAPGTLVLWRRGPSRPAPDSFLEAPGSPSRRQPLFARLPGPQLPAENGPGAGRVRRPWQPPTCPPDGAAGQGPTARPGLEPTSDPEPPPIRAEAGPPARGWTQAAEREALRAPEGNSGQRMGLPEARGGVGGFLPFPGTALPGQFPGLRSPACKHPPRPPRPPRPPSACRAAGPSRTPRSWRPSVDRFPGVSEAGLRAWSRRAPDKLLCRLRAPRRCGVKGRAGPRMPPAWRPPEAPSPYSVSEVEGGGGQDAHSAAATPRPGGLCKASPPGSCPRRPGGQTLGRLRVCVAPVGSGGA